MKISYHDYSDQNDHGYQYYHGVVMLEMFKKYRHLNQFTKFYIKNINKQQIQLLWLHNH